MKLPRFNETSYAHFVTTKTFENKPVFKDKKCCEILLKDIDFYRNKLGFKLIGYVIMTNHLHLIVWWDVEKIPKLTISKIIQSIKGHSAKEIVNYLKSGRRKPSLSPYSQAASEGSQLPGDYQWVDRGDVHTPATSKIWQKDFYDFNIYSDKKLQQKIDYIHWNPVRAGLCKNSGDWPWSSYKFYQRGKQSKIKIDIIN